MAQFPNLALKILDPGLLLTGGPVAGTSIAFRLPTPAPQAIWSTAKLGRYCLISSVVTAIFRALFIEKPNAARAELSRIRRGMFALCHKVHPWRVLLSGKPGAVHTPIGDVFVVTDTYIAGAGRIVTFTGVEVVELDGAGGPDEIYVLSTGDSFETSIIGGSGDDTIHIGGDHPPLIFDPPSFTYVPPPIEVPLPPELVFDTFFETWDDLRFSLGFFDLLARINAAGGSVESALQKFVEGFVDRLFRAWQMANPLIEIVDITVDDISFRPIHDFFLFIALPRFEVTVGTLRLDYQIGRYEERSKLIQPAPVVVDPPAFAFKEAGSFDGSTIAGRLTIVGGDQFEENGDRVIFHNQLNLRSQEDGFLRVREVPRMIQVGEDADGNFIFEHDRDEDTGELLFDTFQSLEGAGLGINESGQLARNTTTYHGVELQGIEQLDVRLPADWDDVFTVEQMLDEIALTIVTDAGFDDNTGAYDPAVGGNDTINIEAVGRQTTILAGAGDDTVNLTAGGELTDILGRLIIDGEATMVERQTTFRADDFGEDVIAFVPKVFIDTDVTDSTFQGRTFVSDPQLAPIVFKQNGNADSPLNVRVVVLDSSGEIIRDLVQEKGVLEFGVHKTNSNAEPLYFDQDGNETTVATITGVPVIEPAAQGDPGAEQVYIDSVGNKVFDTIQPADEDGIDNDGDELIDEPGEEAPTVPAFATDFENGLFITLDRKANKTNALPSILATNGAGADFTVYELDFGGPEFGRIRVEVSDDGDRYHVLTAGAGVRITGDEAHGGGNFFRSYDLDEAGLSQARFIRITGTSAPSEGKFAGFDLDAIGIINPGPEAIRFVSSLWQNNTFSGDATFLGAPDDAGQGLSDRVVEYGGAPSLFEVNRSTVIPWTRIEDVQIDTAAPGDDVLVIDNSFDASDVVGVLDTYQIAVDDLVGGLPTFHDSADSPDAKFHIGGAPVLDPFTGEALVYAGGEPVRDLFSGAVVVDPFGNTVYHQPGDPQLHIAGDPVFQVNGDFQRYIGGEFTFDESGELVLNPVRMTENPSVDFVEDAGGDQIIRSAGNWRLDQFSVGDKIQVSNSGANDGIYAIAEILDHSAVDPGRILVLSAADDLTADTNLANVEVDQLFLHFPGQVKIYDRLERVHQLVDENGGLVEIGAPYTPPTFANPASNVLDLTGIHDLTADDGVTVTVIFGTVIFNLSGSDIVVDELADTVAVPLSIDLPKWDPADPTVAIGFDEAIFKVTIAVEAVHQDGDQRFYFGTEPLVVGQPVVDSVDQLVLDEFGEVALHTEETIGKNLAESFSFFDNFTDADNIPGDGVVTFTLGVQPFAGFVTATLAGVVLTQVQPGDVLGVDADFAINIAAGKVVVDPIVDPVEGSQLVVTYRVAEQLHRRAEPVFEFVNTETFGFDDTTNDGVANVTVTLAVEPLAGTRIFVEIDDEPLDDSEFTILGDSLTITPVTPPSTDPQAEIGVTYQVDPTGLTGDETGTPSWMTAIYAGGEDRLYLGNEPLAYQGGEQAFFTASDRHQKPAEFHRVLVDGGGDGENTEFDLNGFADADTLPQALLTVDPLPAAWFTIFDDQNIVLDAAATVEAVEVEDIGNDQTAGLRWLVDDSAKQFQIAKLDGDTEVGAVDRLEVRRLDAKGMPGEVLFHNLDQVRILIGDGNDIFTIVRTDLPTEAADPDSIAVELDTADGADQIAVRAIAANSDVNVVTGPGDDVVAVGSQAGVWDIDTDVAVFDFGFINVNGTLDDILGDLAIDAGDPVALSDSLSIDDTGDGNDNTGTLTASRITGLDMGGVIDYANFEFLAINLGAGNDTFTIESTHDVDDGDATTPDVQESTTVVEGRGGNDVINVRTIDGPTAIAGDGFAAIVTFGDNEVATGNGNDTINVGSTSNGDQGSADGASGLVDGIDEPLFVDGGSPTDDIDKLNVSDAADGTPNAGELTGDKLLLLGMGARAGEAVKVDGDRLKGITYQRFEVLEIDLGSNDDNFLIVSTHTTLTMLNANGGDDTVNVQTTAGETVINGNDDDDSFNVGSSTGIVATADLEDPLDGSTIGVTDLNQRGFLDVTYRTFGVGSLDADSLDGNELTFSGSGVAGGPVAVPSAVPDRLVRLPDGSLVLLADVPADQLGLEEVTDTFRYGIDGQFVPGDVIVTFVAGSWTDVSGQPNLAGQERFIVEIPTARLVVPVDGAILAAGAVNDPGAIVVSFTTTTGAAIADEPVVDVFDTGIYLNEFGLSRIPTGPVTFKIFRSGDVDPTQQWDVELAQLIGTAGNQKVVLATAEFGSPTARTLALNNVADFLLDLKLEDDVAVTKDGVPLTPNTEFTFDAADNTITLNAAIDIIGATFEVTVSVDSEVRLEYQSVSVNGNEIALHGPGVGTADGPTLDGGVVLVDAATNAYAYSFTGGFIAGLYEIDLVADSWRDSAGNLPAAGSASFTIEQPTADLADPLNGGLIDAAALNAREYIDIVYFATTSTALDHNSIDGNEFELAGPGVGVGGIEIRGPPVRLTDAFDGSLTDTYRYEFDGAFVAGQYSLNFRAAGWSDLSGNDNRAETETFRTLADPADEVVARLVDPLDGVAIGREQLAGRMFVDIAFTPASGAAVADHTIRDPDGSVALTLGDARVAITGAGLTFDGQAAGAVIRLVRLADGLIVDPTDPSLAAEQLAQAIETNIYRFLLTGTVTGGTLDIVVEGGWQDSAGNVGSGVSAAITVDQPVADIVLPVAGSAVGLQQLAGLQVQVTFTPSDTSGIDDDLGVADAAGLVRLKQGAETLTATDVSRIGGTNSFVFTDFAGLGTFAIGGATIEVSDAWMDSSGNVAAAVATRALTIAAPTAQILAPEDGLVVGPAQVDSTLKVLVEFMPTVGNSIDAEGVATDSIADGLVKIGAFSATNASRIAGTNVFEFTDFTGLTATAGDVLAVTLDAAVGWRDSAGNVGATTATAAISVVGPSAEILAPEDGLVLGPAQVISTLEVLVEFHPAGGNSIDAEGIATDAIAVGLVKVGAFSAMAVSRVAGTNIFKFTGFTGLTAVAGDTPEITLDATIGWQDSAGNDGATTATAGIFVVAPTARILVPEDGLVLGPAQVVSTIEVLVEFHPVGGNSIDAAVIASDTIAIGLVKIGAFSATAASRVAGTNIFKFTGFTGLTAATGDTPEITLDAAIGWQDSAGNDGATTATAAISVVAPSAEIVLPPDGQVLDPPQVPSALTIRVEFTPTGGNSIDADGIATDTIAAALVKIGTVSATNVIRIAATNVYEFTGFTGLTAAAGDTLVVTLDDTVGWQDSAGNAGETTASVSLFVAEPTAAIRLPASGLVVGPQELTDLKVAVAFTPVAGNSIDTAGSVTDDIVAGLVTVGGQAASVVLRIAGTDVFEFSGFAGIVPIDGAALQVALDGAVGWQDSGGNTGANSATASLTVDVPSAALSVPLSGSTIPAATLNALGFIDVTFFPSAGEILDLASLDGVVSLSGTGAPSMVLNATPVQVEGTSYRYNVQAGSFLDGPVTVTIANTWKDSAGNTAAVSTVENFTAGNLAAPLAIVTTPAGNSVIDRAGLANLTVQVAFVAIPNTTVNTGTITSSQITLKKGGGIIATSSSVTPLGGNVFSFTISANLLGIEAGDVLTIEVASWQVTDVGDPPTVTIAPATTLDFTVATSLVTLADPFAGTVVSTTELNGRGYVDIRFETAGGAALNAGSITDTAPEISIAPTAGGTALTVDGAAARLLRQADGSLLAAGGGVVGTPTNIFRYAVTDAFAVEQYTVSAIINSWADADGNTGFAGTVGIIDTASGATAATAATAAILLPEDGLVIGPQQVVSTFKVLVAFTPTGGAEIDSDTVMTDSIVAGLVKIGTVSATTVTRIAGTNTFEFTDFTDLSAAAGAALTVSLDSTVGWQDSVGNVGETTATAAISVVAPTARMVLPADGLVLGPQQMISTLKVLVAFEPAGANSIDAEGIAADAIAPGLVKIGTVSATNVARIGGTNTFAFTDFTGLAASDGAALTVSLDSAVGWQDSAGNAGETTATAAISVVAPSAEILLPEDGLVLGPAQVVPTLEVLVEFHPAGGNSIDAEDIATDAIAFGLVKVGTFSATDVSRLAGTNVFSFTDFTGLAATAGDTPAVTLDAAVGWQDSAGNAGETTATAAISVVAPSAEILLPEDGLVLGPAQVVPTLEVLVRFHPAGGNSIDADAIATDTIVAGLVKIGAFSATDVSRVAGTNVFSFTDFTGLAAAAGDTPAVTLDAAVGWQDSAGNAGETTATAAISVLAPSAEILLPADGLALGSAQVISTLEVLVEFHPAGGNSIDATGIATDAIVVGLVKVGAFPATDVSRLAGTNVFKFTDFTGFAAAVGDSPAVTLDAAIGWQDSAGNVGLTTATAVISVVAPSAEILLPFDRATLGFTELANLVVRVNFNPVVKTSILETDIAAELVTLTQGGSTVAAASVERLAGTNTFGFAGFDVAGFDARAVTVALDSAVGWTDSAGNAGETTAAATYAIGTPSADLARPLAGEIIGLSELNVQDRYIDVKFFPVAGNTVDSGSIIGVVGLVSLTGAGVGTAAIDDGSVSRLMRLSDGSLAPITSPLAAGATETNIFRFGFTGNFGTGTVAVDIAGIWRDSAGNVAAAETETIVVDVPQAELSDPSGGATIGRDVLADRGYLDVRFTPTVGNTVAPDTITDSGAEFALSGPAYDTRSADFTFDHKAVRLAGPSDVFRYSFTDFFGPGELVLTFTQNGWQDSAGNAPEVQTDTFVVEAPSARFVDPLDGSEFSLATINDRQYFDVRFFPVSGRILDDASITDPEAEFILGGRGALNVTVDATPILTDAATNTYRYGFTGKFDAGSVTVEFVADAWNDAGAVANVNWEDAAAQGFVLIVDESNVNGIGAPLTIDGAAGFDLARFDDTSDADRNILLLTDVHLAGLGMVAVDVPDGASPGVTYAFIEVLNIGLGSGDDIVLVHSTNGETSPGLETTTNISTYDGNDAIAVGSNAATSSDGLQWTNAGGDLNGVLGLLRIDGGSETLGGDQLDIDDTADLVGNFGLLKHNRLTGLGMSLDMPLFALVETLEDDEILNNGITYDRVEDLTVKLGDGGDVFSVLSTHGGTTTVWTNEGDDIVNVGTYKVDTGPGPGAVNVVNEIRGSLTIRGGVDSGLVSNDLGDVLNIHDNFDNAAGAGTLTSDSFAGFGMPDVGVAYHEFELLNLFLGTGVDRLFVDTTHQGRTEISTGSSTAVAVVEPKTEVVAESGMVGVNDANLTFAGAEERTQGFDPIALELQEWRKFSGSAVDPQFTGHDGSYVQALNSADSGASYTVNADYINHTAGRLTRTVDTTDEENPTIVEVNQATISYQFVVDDGRDGLYDLDIRAAALSDNADSFWVQVLREQNGQFVTLPSTLTENLLAGIGDGLAVFIETDGAFEWYDAGLWDLFAGTYRIQVTMRESGAAIEMLRLGLFAQQPSDDEVNVREIDGVVVINGEGGDDVFNINYNEDGRQTFENLIGKREQQISTLSEGPYELQRKIASAQFVFVTIDKLLQPFENYHVNLMDNTVTLLSVDPEFGPNAEVRIDYLVSRVELHGQHGSDVYTVGLAGDGQSLVDVIDKRGSEDVDPGNSQDLLVIQGTDQADNFLLRPLSVFSLGQDGFGSALDQIERVNYDGNVNRGLVINGRDGDDRFSLDDNDVITTINGDAGDDSFQVGQLFDSIRETNANLLPLDQFETTITTRGYLSNGIVVATTLNGGDGEDDFVIFHVLAAIGLNGGRDNDRFTVRAFVEIDKESAKESFSNVNGGQGADFIAYVANAPVNIDGGDGFDTVVIIGTEFGDDFVITDQGTFGAGLFVQFTGIEELEINGGEGNDTFFVLSTSEKVSTVILGGLGSDTFNVAGNDTDDPIAVVSNDLRGHSGIVTHGIESGNLSYDGLKVAGISVNVADDEAAGVVLTEIGGSTLVIEPSVSIAELGAVDSYTLVLTRKPEETVRITVSPSAQTEEQNASGARSVSVRPDPLSDLDNNSTTLVFTTVDWFIPQTVTVTALPDAAREGRRFITLQHSTNQGSDAFANVLVTSDGTRRMQEISHDANRGTFTITFDGFTTAIIDHDATPADIELRLENLPIIDNVTVVGSGVITDSVDDPWVIEFVKVVDLDGAEVVGTLPELTVDARRLRSPYDGLAIRSIVVELIDDDQADVIIMPVDAQDLADGTTRVTEGMVADRFDVAVNGGTAQTVTLANRLIDAASVAVFVDGVASGDFAVDMVAKSVTIGSLDATDTEIIVNYRTADGYLVRLSKKPDAKDAFVKADAVASDEAVENPTYTFALSRDRSTSENRVTVTLDGRELEFGQVKITTGIGDDPDTVIIELDEVLSESAVVEAIYEATTTEPLVVTIALDLDGTQLAVSPALLSFTDDDWDVPQLVHLTAIDDFVREGPHNVVISHSVLVAGTDFDGVDVGQIDVRVLDNDAAGVLVTETDGSTDVIESDPEMVLGSGIVDAGSGSNTLVTEPDNSFAFSEAGAINFNTFRFTRMELTDPDETIDRTPEHEADFPLTARDFFGFTGFFQDHAIDDANWTMFSDPNIGDLEGNTSDRIPHVTIDATGDGLFTDNYTFTAKAGSRGIFDVDRSDGGVDTQFILWDVTTTTILAWSYNSDISDGAGGSSSSADAYLEYTFNQEGVYRIQVFDSFFSVFNSIRFNGSYQLQISLENHDLRDIAFDNIPGMSPEINATGAFAAEFVAGRSLADTTPAALRIEFQIDGSEGVLIRDAILDVTADETATVPIDVQGLAVLDLDIVGMFVEVEDIDGVEPTQRRVIESFAADREQLTVTEDWLWQPDAGDTFRIITPTRGAPYSDTYTVVLTSQPLDDVVVMINPAETRTLNRDQIFDDTQDNGERREIQVIVADRFGNQSSPADGIGLALAFTSANWNVPQTVTVTAVDDDVIDGGGVKVFPDIPERLNDIRGPLTIEGGTGGRPDPILGEPFKLPFETNDRIPDGFVDAATLTELTDDDAPWIVDSGSLVVSDPTEALALLFNAKGSDIEVKVEVVDPASEARTLSADDFEIDVVADTISFEAGVVAADEKVKVNRPRFTGE